jgi:hypothetical protein
MKSVHILKDILFLCSIVIFSSMLGAADRPPQSLHEKVTRPARQAATFSLPMIQISPNANLRERGPTRTESALNANQGYDPEIIGYTMYDIQYLGAAARQVEHRAMYINPPNAYGEYIHFAWTSKLIGYAWPEVGIGYEAYDIGACDKVFQSGGIRIEPDNAAFVALDANPGWAIIAANMDMGGEYQSNTFWDFTMGGPVFGVFTPEQPYDLYGWYQNNGTGPDNANLWPKIEWDIDGVEEVLHMVATECGGDADDPMTISYYRRVGPYGVGNGFWSDQRVIDTVMDFSVTVASSPISDKVALVWTAPCDYIRDSPDEFDNHFENDVWFSISTDGGVSWDIGSPYPSIGNTVDYGHGGGYFPMDGGNLTVYYDEYDWKASSDLTALWFIDEYNDDWLQIGWGCRRWTDTTSVYRRQSALFHWNQLTDVIRPIIKARWDSGGHCYIDPWSSDVTHLTLSECDEKLYALFTQYGREDNPCDDADYNNLMLNGYLYISVFDPAYDAWDRPQRVTTTPETPFGCTPGDINGPGDCNSEGWGSMARYGRVDACKLSPEGNGLDILYINDYAPGAVITDISHECDPVSMAGDMYDVPENPVMWVVYPCREAVPEPLYADDAGEGYGVCYEDDPLVVGTYDDTTFFLTIENPGILPNNYSIDVSIDSGSFGYTEVSAIPDIGTIPPADFNDIEINIFTSGGEPDGITVYAHLTVTHEGPDSPRIIPMCIIITDSYFAIEYHAIFNDCKRLRTYNSGRMSNNAANASLDFTEFTGDSNYCAEIYLRDGSPIICRDIGGEIQCFYSMYDNTYASDNSLRPMSSVEVDSVTNPWYVHSMMEFITADSTIRMAVDYFAARELDSCGFIIQKLRYWNNTDAVLNGVAVGEVLDWDIPSYDSDVKNGSSYETNRELIYQYCCFDPVSRDPCDTLSECERHGGIAAWHQQPFKNYMTLENDMYVYPGGPYGFDVPLPPDAMYDLMTTNDGFMLASPDTCEDIFTLVTFDIHDLQPHDTQCVISILATSKEDVAWTDLEASIDKANAFIDSYDEIACFSIPDTCDLQMPGDPNGDGWISAGDAAYIIAYLCNDGPAPDPLANGDANGDCVIDGLDADYILDHVFGGGPPPVECTCVEPATGICAHDDICTNSWCDPAFVVCPGGDGLFRVYLRDIFDNPIVGETDAWVEFINCNSITPCPNSSQQFTVLYPVAPSDENGMLAFYMDGGGCDDACSARVVTSVCILDTIPVKALDTDGDYVVSINNDFDFSLCNDYNGDGQVDFNDVNIFNAHVPHACDIDPCDQFGFEFNLNPESNLLPGQVITLELELANNNIQDSCYIGFVGFFYSEYGSGVDETLIENVPFNSTLGPSQEALISIPYTIPPEGHGCLHAKFMTDCCAENIELTQCFQSTLHCRPDSNVCYEMHIKLNTVPIIDNIWNEFLPEGWSLNPIHVPPLPLYVPDSILFSICTPNLSDLGDSAVVIITTCYNEDCTDFGQFENRVVISSQTGDVNNDCWVNIGDAVYLISYVFKYGPAPIPLESGDTNCDCAVNVGDAVKVINFVFKGGLPPCNIDEADCP